MIEKVVWLLQARLEYQLPGGPLVFCRTAKEVREDGAVISREDDEPVLEDADLQRAAEKAGQRYWGEPTVLAALRRHYGRGWKVKLFAGGPAKEGPVT
jgi:hypothetical protein